MLRKIKGLYSESASYCGLLEGEVVVWRGGGTVSESDWVSLQTSKGKTTSTSPSRDLVETPRPSTPSASLGSDERDAFVIRENEISDQLFSSEAVVKKRDVELGTLKEEMTFLRGRETKFSTENKDLLHSVNEMQSQLESIAFEAKDSVIMVDSLKEDNKEMSLEIALLKVL
jgi:kinesin family protein 5